MSQVSRKSEQCEAEGILLRFGAKDPLKNFIPLVLTNHGQEAEQASKSAPPDIPNGKSETAAAASEVSICG